ncbi:MAG TPA: ATP-binding domain-containing protein [Streptosporangiaceae bacterium]|nr:ATP-binding domain-containing protein [Streptosporangiaceae bacterium]
MSNAELDREQSYISVLYGRLDVLRERAGRRMAGVLRQAGGTHQARVERETFSAMYRQQLAQFDAAENGLCFGRLEFNDGELRYVGRLGIHADTDDYEQLLMDWRADAARPFYLATAASPGDVRVRRHIKSKGRTVVGIDDEVLDLEAADPTRHEGLTGESALLAALNSGRTGSMSDIVETIQAEQDVIIRAPMAGALVVQGGPGTGKTAVALHRAAYLLYTYRRQLEKRGVLVVGPNATFLRYIGQVLPSLGETSVLLSTIGDLFPGVSATAAESAQTAAIKGRIGMARVIAAAIRDRQHVPDEPLEIKADVASIRLATAAGREEAAPAVGAGAGRLRLTPRTISQARERARRSRRPHNQARSVFAREIVNALTRQLTARIGTDVRTGEMLMDQQDMQDLRRELRADPAVRAAIARLWPVLSPQQLVSDLLTDPARLAAAAPRMPAAERELLLREDGAAWTPADVPLLDEAADLLGEDDRGARAAAARRRRQEEAYAQGVLDIMSRDEDDDEEILMGADLVDASRLAARYEDEQHLTAAERAAVDRTWVFGHVIVDEAQELSQLAWRMLMRRCPARSLTIVGDVAQTGDLGGLPSWSEALEPYLGDRWRLAPLTVNYRTAAEIMAVAADVLAAIDPALELPRSVRQSGRQPWQLQAEPAELTTTVAQAAVRLAAEAGDGKLAVIVPAALADGVGAAVRAALPGTALGADPDLTSPVVVLTVRQAKGLEFDCVLIADPAAILAESPRGLNDLYVALTRATQQVGVVHPGRLPDVLARLAPALSPAGIGG